METVGGLVAGSHNRNQLVVIRGDDQYQHGNRSNFDLCQLCSTPVGLNADGEPFVACYECALPVCHECYSFRRREKQACPRCKHSYKRHKGFPRVDGDPDEDNVDDIENEFMRPAQVPTGQQHLQWASGAVDGYGYSQHQPSPQQSPYRQAYPIHARNPLLLTNGTVYSDDGGSIAGDSEVSTRAFDVLSMQHSFVGGPDGGHPFMSPARSHGGAPSPAEAQRDARRLAKRQLMPADGRDSEGYGFGSIAVAEAKRSKQQQPQPQQETLGPVPEDREREDAEAGHEGPPDTNGPTGFVADDRESLLEDDGRQPLSRKVPLPPARIYPYRLVIVLRLVVVALFFRYRIMNPVKDAYALWLVSVICEVWFAFSWILDQFPKWFPINRETYPTRLFKRFEERQEESKLEAVDLFVSTVDPIKEPILTTANTLLSILAMDYPVDKISCYLSDDGAAYLTFEACRFTAEFAKLWVPFCKQYNIEPRAPEMYFRHNEDYTKGQVDTSFIQARRLIKKEYEAFKVTINALVKTYESPPEEGWVMQDGTLWPGNDYRDHPGMIQVFLGPGGGVDAEGSKLPRLAYVSREKRPGYNHHKKAGAMNAMVRVSAVLTNAPYLLNLDCDHYVNNSRALREAMCFMLDQKVGKRVCYVQFPQRFDGIDKNDRYANHNTVFFDINMRGLDGLQGPVYVGTGCCFRRLALYGFDAPEKEDKPGHLGGLCCCCTWCCGRKRKGKKDKKAHAKKGLRVLHGLHIVQDDADEEHAGEGLLHEEDRHLLEKRFGPSSAFVTSVFVHDMGLPPPAKEQLMAEYLAHKGEESKGVHAAGDPKKQIKELINVLTCGYEDKSDWGKELGWIYGSVTEDILTGFKMHCRGWRSIYCMPKRPAFKGSAPINLSDRLQQVLRWALGSVEIFFSNHCPIWYGANGRLKCLQRLAYINTVVYPFTAFPLLAYCTIPAICLITNKFIVPALSAEASILYVALFISIFATAILEIRWSGIGLDEWWRNEQFWVIGGVSSHFFAVAQGLLKVLAGVDTNFTVTSKQSDDNAGEFAELYLFKWTSLLIPPTTLIFLNLFGILAGFAVAITGGYEAWGPFLGKFFFAMWVVVHLYPFLKGLMGRHDRTPTLIIVWSVLLASIFCLLWVKVDPFISKGGGPNLVVCGVKC